MLFFVPFPHFYFPPPSSFSSSLLPFLTPPTRGGDEKGCSTKMGKCLFERDNETRDKTLSLLHPNSLSLFLLSVFLSLLGGGRVKLFDVRFPFTLALGFFPRRRFSVTNFCRIFKKSSLDLDISNTYRPFKPHRRFNM